MALTPRGVRTSVGPRGARVHFGAGRPTISTGRGPVTLWTPVGHPPAHRRPASAGAAQQRAARATPAPRDAADTGQDGQLIDELVHAHTRTLAAAQRPVVPAPAPVDAAELERELTEQALAAISRLHHHERALARERARAQAAAEADQRNARARRDHAADQARADQQWRALCANDPETVVCTLEATFEHLHLPAAPLDCTGEHATIALRFPEAEALIPARRPSLTPTGRPTTRALSKSERARLYFEAVCSHTLLTGRLALAGAPGLAAVSVIVFGGAGTATAPICPIFMMALDRPTVQAIDWGAPAGQLALRFERLALLTGRAAELSPLSLVEEPELASVLNQLADQLDVALDPRCLEPLRPGQRQHFRAAAANRPAASARGPEAGQGDHALRPGAGGE